MKIIVRPGMEIILHIHYQDHGVDVQKTSPKIATVLTVQRGCFTVHDHESCTGLATVICHGASGEKGTYWYEYDDKNHQPKQADVMRISITGEDIITSSFIID